MTQPLRSVYDSGVAALTEAGIAEAEVDALLLIGAVLGVSRGRVQALMVLDEEVDADTAERIRTTVARRAAREPVQHITGRAPFRSFELAVGPGVFVPRPETEIVAEYAIDALRATASPQPRAVDLGTGSGALGLALAHEVPHAEVWAVEASDQARRWAARNIDELGLANIRLVAGDFAAALPELNGTVDVVVSNPPYVPDAAIPVEPEVQLFDPAEALYAGDDGLDAIRVLAGVAHRLLRPGGAVVLEHGQGQGAAVRAILASHGFVAAATHPDLTRRDRVTTAVGRAAHSLG